jgi:hypothetical protein
MVDNSVNSFDEQFTKELLELLKLSNSVYILKLKNGWYIGSFIETTLRSRLTNHDCFKNDTFMSIYCIINVSRDSYIDSAVIERCMQNYEASVLKISKNSIYSCGVQGFIDTKEQIKEVITSTLSQVYLPSFVKFDNNILGLIQFNEFYLAQGRGFWKKLVINKVVDTYRQTERKRYYDENKEKIKSVRIARRLINKKEEEK